MDLEGILLSELSQIKKDKQILYDIIYMWNLKNNKLVNITKKKLTHREQTSGFRRKGEGYYRGGSTIEVRGTNWMNLEPTVQTEVKSEREKQISYINAYIWNREKGY